MFEVRASGPFERMEVIDMVAKKVPAPHTVDLTNPDRTIMVSCVKVSRFPGPPPQSIPAQPQARCSMC